MKKIACFPLYPPLELFHSMGFNPVILWGQNRSSCDLTEANKHLESFTCRIARDLVQSILTDYLTPNQDIAGIYFYNACDTLRNTPEIIQTVLQEKGTHSIPFFNIHIPQTNLLPGNGEQYLKKEIRGLIASLEHSFDIKFSREAFQKSVALYHDYRNLMAQLEELVASGQISFETLNNLSERTSSLPVEEKKALLSTAIQDIQSKSGITKLAEHNHKGKIILSGILPPPPSITAVIENANIRIAGNDIALLRRSYGNSSTLHANFIDPEVYYADFYRNHVPCPTLLPSSDARIKDIIAYCQEKKANGVIFLGEKYCEYEYFEFPYLKKKLNAQGIKTLELEFEGEIGDRIGTYKTRIETFASLLETN